MNYHLTSPERMILESLCKTKKTTAELVACTALDKEVLRYILESLLSKNIIITEDSKFCLNPNLNQQMKSSLRNMDEITIEIKDIISNCISLSQKQIVDFKFKKIHVTKQEEIVLQDLLRQVDRFIESLHKNVDRPISEQKLIFWGEGNYGKIINSCIHM